VLAYLARYTHRVAISNSRLISADSNGVTFKYKDYRIEGPERYKTMTLKTGEFIRRFLMHVLPKGFHRIRHYGLLANGTLTRTETIQCARQLIAAAEPLNPPPQPPLEATHEDAARADTSAPAAIDHPCPCCGSRMVIIEVFDPGRTPRNRPTAPVPKISIDSS
jgi:Putative transposase